jgi:hypothetical protein
MNKNEIANKMIEYAIFNWKYQFYECEREEAIEDLTSEDGLNQFIENLNEDLSNDARREDATELLNLVNSIR